MNKVWITDNLVMMTQHRDKVFRKWKNARPTNPLRREYETEYKRFRNVVAKEIYKVKQDYYKNKFDEYKRDIKNTWQVINEVVGKSKRMSVDLVINKYLRTLYSAEEVASRFVDTFVDEITGIQHKCSIVTPTELFNFTQRQSMYLAKVSLTNVMKVIQNLNVNKQPGIDGIRVLDLK